MPMPEFIPAPRCVFSAAAASRASRLPALPRMRNAGHIPGCSPTAAEAMMVSPTCKIFQWRSGYPLDHGVDVRCAATRPHHAGTARAARAARARHRRHPLNLRIRPRLHRYGLARHLVLQRHLAFVRVQSRDHTGHGAECAKQNLLSLQPRSIGSPFPQRPYLIALLHLGQRAGPRIGKCTESRA